MDIKISIIVPVYNMEKYLPACLNSITAQTLKDIEIICIDDGSTDNTAAILKEYEKKKQNIVVLYQKRMGAGDARNRGIEAAKGRYIAFMDADDYYPSDDVLETLFDQAVTYGVKAAGGNYFVDYEGTLEERDPYRFEKDQVMRFEEYQYYLVYCRFIYDREMLKKNDITFPPYVRNQDPIFMIRSLSCADKIWVTSKCTYVNRITDKKLKFNSANVMVDIAKGTYDMIHFSRKHNYGKLIERVVSGIQERNKVCFLLHILNGNEELYGYWKKISQELGLSGYRKNREDYFDASLHEMKEYIEKYSQRIRGYIHIMEKYEEIIIYGAGRIGRSVFDIIESRENLRFGGFAVTSPNPRGTARGEAVYCINNYLDKKDAALLVIAGTRKVSEKMEKTAKELGFRNILLIHEEAVDVDNFHIINDKFAV